MKDKDEVDGENKGNKMTDTQLFAAKTENQTKGGVVFEQVDNPSFWNVILIAKDGSLLHNKLTVGLTFPALAKTDMFASQPEPTLIMADFTIQDIRLLIQVKLKSLCEKVLGEEELQQVDKFETDLDWTDLNPLEENVDCEDLESPPSKKKKRGRPKGSTKKVKAEPDSDIKKAKIILDENEDGLPKKDRTFLFPLNFDLQAANEKFLKRYEEVKEGSLNVVDEQNQQEKFKCCLCEEVVLNIGVHVGKSHGYPDFICPKCDFVCGSEYLLKQHEKGHSDLLNKKGGNCTKCDRFVEHLTDHMKQEHKTFSTNASIQCTQCDKVYNKNSEFQRHFNSTHLGIKANCPICQKELLPTKITSHIRMVHEKVKNHWCKDCGKGFFDKRDMDLHIQRIHLHTKELCIECGKELSAGQLKNHIKKCHSGEAFKVICPVCGKKVGYLDEHMRSVHKKEKNFKCPHCPLEVYKKNTLKRHLVWHEKKKLTVNGILKKPRILKISKDDLNNESLQQPIMTAAATFPVNYQVSAANSSAASNFAAVSSSFPAPSASANAQTSSGSFPFGAFPDPSNIMHRGLYFNK